MDKEIKKQLKGKNDDQWSKDQAHSLDNQQNTRIHRMYFDTNL